MSVTLNPAAQLAFQRPLTAQVKRSLTVTNNNNSPIAFKIKTTAPKSYCVRPNSGRIEPGESVEVQVLLQPMKEDPPAGTKCKDKFLVQSVIITPSRETKSLPELWSEVEKSDKVIAKDDAEIREQKIRCVYLPASGGLHPASALQSNNSSPLSPENDRYKIEKEEDEEGKAGDSSLLADSSFATIAEPIYTPMLSPSVASFAPRDITPSSGFKSSAKKEESTPIIASSAPPMIKKTHSPVVEATSLPVVLTVAEQLSAARSEIDTLRAQLVEASSGLRSRSNHERSSSKSTAVNGDVFVAMEKLGQEGGVPINIVMGLVVGTFVFTWLFF